jgi:exosortase A-associated hydrolase 1
MERMSKELAISFACAGARMIGILHMPESPAKRAVLIVTGGPQYRVGSHRQFVLLARQLAEQDFAVMRFDYRGMGDSSGKPQDFRSIGLDIHAAIQQIFAAAPQVEQVVLCGLCDGATAAAFFAHQDARVAGLILLNPWTRTEYGEARVRLRHYYAARLGQTEFWRKLAAGRIQWKELAGSLARTCRSAFADQPESDEEDLPSQLHRALTSFRGGILVILSGDDFTAREFAALQSQHPHWAQLMHEDRVRQMTLPLANHTFSRAIWREEVAIMCAEWIKSW